MQQLTHKLSYKVGSAKGINEWEKALMILSVNWASKGVFTLGPLWDKIGEISSYSKIINNGEAVVAWLCSRMLPQLSMAESLTLLQISAICKFEPKILQRPLKH
jgi:hypothetical protein